MLKVWSKGLLLRSTISAQASAIYAVDWSPSCGGCDCLAFVSVGTVHVKPLAPHSRALSWKGHDGVILALAWGPYIATAGEDKRYKVWDGRGRLIFASQPHAYPLTCLAWSVDALVLGSFDLIKLAMRDGLACSLEYLHSVHSLVDIAWSPDATQIVAATSSGRVVFSFLSGRKIETKSHSVTLMDTSRILLRSLNSGDEHELDLGPGNVVTFSAGFGHIIAVTSKGSGFVYKIASKIEHKFELKSPSVKLILQCERSFGTFDSSSGSLSLFTYDGKVLVPSIKWVGVATYDSLVDKRSLSLSSDYVAAIDATDPRVIHWVTLPTQGKTATSNSHTSHCLQLVALALNMRQPRVCAFLDVNNDLYMVKVNGDRFIRIHSAIEDIRWSEDTNLLAGISQSKQLLLWLAPSVAFGDADLITECMVLVDTLQGPSLSLSTFSDTTIVLLSGLVSLSFKLNPACVMLLEYCESGNLEKGLNLCRLLPPEDPYCRPIWASLAGSALQSRHLTVAEAAYSYLDKVHRVVYLNRVQELTDNNARNAELSLLAGESGQAESILLQSGLILRVILLRLSLFNWDSALDLALQHREKHPEYLKLVLWKRKEYLDQFDRAEEKRKFVDLQEEIADEDEEQLNEQVTHLLRYPFSKV